MFLFIPILENKCILKGIQYMYALLSDKLVQTFTLFRSFNLIQKKVSKYWPDHNDTKRNGNITVHCQTERIYAEHVIRHLRVHTSFVSYSKYWCLISYFKIM